MGTWEGDPVVSRPSGRQAGHVEVMLVRGCFLLIISPPYVHCLVAERLVLDDRDEAGSRSQVVPHLPPGLVSVVGLLFCRCSCGDNRQ